MAESEKFIPPYGVPWGTFINGIERMSQEGLPSRVDRSYLSNQAGNTQTYFMQGLRSFGLIEENGAVTETLKRLTADTEEARKDRMAALLHDFYDPIIKLGQTTATQAQLEETWTETYAQTGDTRRKAVRFFLAASEYAGLTHSKLWKAPRATAPGAPRKARAAKKTPSGAGAAQRTPTPTATGDTYRVTLLGGGTVTVTVAESHFNLSKHRDDRTFVYGLVDAMTAYAEQSGQEVAGAAEEEEEQTE